MSRFSRRSLLCAGATGATAGLAGCLSGGSPSLDTTPPAEGTWPLAHYDSPNSGHNPNATPPRSEVEPTWTVNAPVPAQGLLIADGLLAAYGDQGLVVVRLSDRQRVLEELDPAPVAGIVPATDGGHTLYAAGPRGVRNGTFVQIVRGWEYTAEEHSQSIRRTYEMGDSRGPAGLVANSETVVVGHHAGQDEQLVAFDADSGDIQWQNDGIYPTFAGGSLVVTGSSGVSRYTPRSGLDTYLNGGLKETWSAPYSGITAPTVSSERVIIGGEWSTRGGIPTLFGYDAETGDELWDPLDFGGTANAPTVVNDRGYLSSFLYEDFGGYYLPNSGELRRIDLQNGTVTWMRETEWVPSSVVAGNNGVVISCGGFPDGEAYTDSPNGERGRIRAYDAESGEVLWTFTTSQYVETVVLVGSTVYAGSSNGTVYALRTA